MLIVILSSWSAFGSDPLPLDIEPAVPPETTQVGLFDSAKAWLPTEQGCVEVQINNALDGRRLEAEFDASLPLGLDEWSCQLTVRLGPNWDPQAICQPSDPRALGLAKASGRGRDALILAEYGMEQAIWRPVGVLMLDSFVLTRSHCKPGTGTISPTHRQWIVDDVRHCVNGSNLGVHRRGAEFPVDHTQADPHRVDCSTPCPTTAAEDLLASLTPEVRERPYFITRPGGADKPVAIFSTMGQCESAGGSFSVDIQQFHPDGIIQDEFDLVPSRETTK